MKSTTHLLFLLFTFISPCLSQWTPLKTPYGAKPISLYESEGRIFCPISQGSFFSDDDGAHWNRCFTNDYANGGFNFLVNHDSIIIAQISNAVNDEREMVISMNNGDSWSRMETPDGGIYPNPDFGFNSRTILYSVNGKTYRSEDLGINWTLMDTFEMPFTFNSLVTTGDLFFARHTDGSLWRSDTTGTQWDSLTFADTTREFPYVYQDADILMVGVNKGNIHYSYDHGESWNISNGVSNYRGTKDAFYRQGDTLYALHNNRIYQSLDMAVNWELKSPQLRNISDIIIRPGYIIFIEYEGIYKTYDYGHTVIPLTEGIEHNTLYDIAIEGDQCWYFSDDQISSGVINEEEVSLDSLIIKNLSLDQLIIADEYAIVEETAFEGLDSWNRLVRISPDGEQKIIYEDDFSQWLVQDHLKYTDGKLCYFVIGSLTYSSDFGDTWLTQEDLGLPLCFDLERHENALFAVGENGILRKMDGESEWHEVHTGLNFENEPIEGNKYKLRINSTPGALFLQLIRSESDNTIEFFVTHNLGESWTPILTEYPDIPVQYLNSPVTVKNIISIPGFHLMALRDLGVLISADLGLNWTPYNDGLPQQFGWQTYALEKYDTMAIVSVTNYGLWKLKPREITIQYSAGKVFHDINSNGTPSVGEPGVYLSKVLLSDSGLLDFTDQAGAFNFYHRDVDTIRVKTENPHVTVVPEKRLTSEQNKFFALQLTEDVHDISIELLSDQVHRSGFPVRYYINYRNLGKAVSGIVLNLIYDERLTFVDADVHPFSTTGNSLLFAIDDLDALESGRIVLEFMLAQAPNGTLIHSICNVVINESDVNLINNTDYFIDVVTGSYDPNDITVSHEKVKIGDVANGQLLRYMIRFQNVGTYYAEDVIIRNPVNKDLDVVSISGFETSHPGAINFENGELVFTFDNIMLPDSSRDNANSNGFVKYDILVSKAVEVGDTITNLADIYFDFNLPVRTNTALTLVEDINAVEYIDQQQSLMIYPNPTSRNEGVRIIQAPATGVLRIIDMQGQLCYTVKQFTGEETIYINDLIPGMYILTLETSSKVYYSKLVVE